MNKKEIDFDNINIITVAKVASANFLRCNYKNKINEKHHGHSLLHLKNVLEKSKNSLIIVGIRNPIDRNLSYLFQTKGNDLFNDVKTKNNNYKGEYCYIPEIKPNTSYKEIIKLYFKQNYHNTFNEWFREFLEITKINSFNRKKGLDFYNFPNNNTIMIYTLEKLNENKAEICDLLGITNFQNTNNSNNREYKNQYKEVKDNIIYKKQYLDNLLNTEIIRLFYNNSDIEKFYLKYKVFDEKNT
jgi:hypothetical protein